MSCLLVFLFLSTSSCSDLVVALFCSKRSLGPSSSGALVSTTPLLSQGGSDIFAAIVPPLRSSVRSGDFLKKKIAK